MNKYQFKKIQTLAQRMLDQFEIRKRNDGTQYVCLKDGYASWMQDVCREAHDNMMPDDYRYSFIVDACQAIVDVTDPDCVGDSYETPVYTSQVTSWLSSRCDRVDYLSQALGETDIKDGSQLLNYAYELEFRDVLALVQQSLEKIVNEVD